VRAAERLRGRPCDPLRQERIALMCASLPSQRLLLDPALSDNRSQSTNSVKSGPDHHLLEHIDRAMVICNRAASAARSTARFLTAIKDLHSRSEGGLLRPFRRPRREKHRSR
jgi:hypothetical protein